MRYGAPDDFPELCYIHDLRYLGIFDFIQRSDHTARWLQLQLRHLMKRFKVPPTLDFRKSLLVRSTQLHVALTSYHLDRSLADCLHLINITLDKDLYRCCSRDCQGRRALITDTLVVI